MYRVAHSTLLSALLLLMTATTYAAASGLPILRQEPRFLPVDEAFQLTVTRHGGIVEVRWFVMPGYYLYRKSLGFNVAGEDIEVNLPDGEQRHDEYFGDVEVYFEELMVDVKTESAELEVWYQGCAEAGYCYPPQKKRLNVANVRLSP